MRTNSLTISVACAVSKRYVLPTAVMVRSLLTFLDSATDVRLFIVEHDLTDEDKQRLLESWPSDRLTVLWLPMDVAALSDMPLWGRMKVDTYCRLQMPEFLPESVEKIIWLDSDLIINANLQKLWVLDPGSQPVLAVQDMVVPFVSSTFGISRYRELGIPPAAPYFNAGVMVVNLKVWRNRKVTERATNYLRESRGNVFFWDQEGLNVALAGEWGQLDPRWNQIATVAGRAFFKPRHMTEDQYMQVTHDPWILHYAGFWKPWLYESRSSHPYFFYLDQTAWRGWRPNKNGYSILLQMYNSGLRNYLYPLEKWGLILQRKMHNLPNYKTAERKAR